MGSLDGRQHRVPNSGGLPSDLLEREENDSQPRRQLPPFLSTEASNTRNVEMKTCVINTPQEFQEQNAHGLWSGCGFSNHEALLSRPWCISRDLFAPKRLV